LLDTDLLLEAIDICDAGLFDGDFERLFDTVTGLITDLDFEVDVFPSIGCNRCPGDFSCVGVDLGT